MTARCKVQGRVRIFRRPVVGVMSEKSVSVLTGAEWGVLARKCPETAKARGKGTLDRRPGLRPAAEAGLNLGQEGSGNLNRLVLAFVVGVQDLVLELLGQAG